MELMKTYTAAICEDRPQSLEYIHTCLKQAFASREVKVSFSCYTDSTVLLTDCARGTKYDLLFLDIDMPKLNGIDLGKKLRMQGSDAILVYISDKDEMVFQTFEVQPFRFVRKSRFDRELQGLVRSICAEFDRQTGTVIRIHERHSDRIFSLNVNDIIFIEAQRKNCRVVMAGGEFDLQYRLDDFRVQLEPHGFLQPHRSYLVNCRYIYRIEKSCILLDSRQTVPLSRGRADAVRQDFIRISNELAG